MNESDGKEGYLSQRLLPIGKQIFASMAIGLTLFMCLEAIVQFAFGLETADQYFTPITMNLLAVLAFPFVRRFMNTDG